MIAAEELAVSMAEFQAWLAAQPSNPAHALSKIALPTLHQQQLAIEQHPARRKVLCMGRRWGKTTLGAVVAIKRMYAGRRILLASTTQEQADSFWDKAKEWLGPMIDAGAVEKNEQRRILTLPGSPGRIKVKTASDADSLRGDYADLLILDEAALLAPDAWDKVGAPMLMDNDGEAWFLSTPRRMNWFFNLYQRSIGDGVRWAAWHATSFDNPFLSPDALNEIASDLSQDAYRQEILAEFLEGEGAVFRNIAANLTAPANPDPAAHRSHHVVMGADWGRQHDFTALSVFCATCAQELFLDRFNKVEWAFQRGRLGAAYTRWHVSKVLAEENSIGGPNIEALQKDGLRVIPFTTTATSKPPLIQSLALAFERNEARWLNDPVATAELTAYEATVSKNTGRMSYGAPEGMHDDTVIARALAYRAAFTGSYVGSF